VWVLSIAGNDAGGYTLQVGNWSGFTKAFTTQINSIYLVACKIGRKREFFNNPLHEHLTMRIIPASRSAASNPVEL